MRMPGFSAEASLYNRSRQWEHLDSQMRGTGRRTVVPALDLSDIHIGTTPLQTTNVGPLSRYKFPPLKICPRYPVNGCCMYSAPEWHGNVLEIHCIEPPSADGCCWD